MTVSEARSRSRLRYSSMRNGIFSSAFDPRFAATCAIFGRLQRFETKCQLFVNLFVITQEDMRQKSSKELSFQRRLKSKGFSSRGSHFPVKLQSLFHNEWNYFVPHCVSSYHCFAAFIHLDFDPDLWNWTYTLRNCTLPRVRNKGLQRSSILAASCYS